MVYFHDFVFYISTKFMLWHHKTEILKVMKFSSQSVPKIFWQTSPNSILEEFFSIWWSKFYANFTSLNQFLLEWGLGLGLVVFGRQFIHSKYLFLPGIVIHMLLTLENCSVIFCMFAPFLPMMYLCSHAGAATSDKTLLLACRI